MVGAIDKFKKNRFSEVKSALKKTKGGSCTVELRGKVLEWGAGLDFLLKLESI